MLDPFEKVTNLLELLNVGLILIDELTPLFRCGILASFIVRALQTNQFVLDCIFINKLAELAANSRGKVLEHLNSFYGSIESFFGKKWHLFLFRRNSSEVGLHTIERKTVIFVTFLVKFDGISHLIDLFVHSHFQTFICCLTGIESLD